MELNHVALDAYFPGCGDYRCGFWFWRNSGSFGWNRSSSILHFSHSLRRFASGRADPKSLVKATGKNLPVTHGTDNNGRIVFKVLRVWI
jgi:hypothetical protein